MAQPRELARGLSRLDALGAQLDQAIFATERVARAGKDIQDTALNLAALNVRDEVIKALRINLAASGIGKDAKNKKRYSPAGNLAAALDKVIVKVEIRNGINLRVQMPKEMPPYVSKPGGDKSSFHTVAASLNYGAVRNVPKKTREKRDLPTGRLLEVGQRDAIGAKAKRSLKRMALGGEISDRARQGLTGERTVTLRSGGTITTGFDAGHKTKEDSKSVTLSSGVVVIKPRPFFELKSGQQKAIAQKFTDVFLRAMSSLLGG